MKIAVTGHRPKHLGNAYDIHHPINIAMGRYMRDFILTKSKETNEKITLISGGALGVDTIFALVALKLRKEYPNKFLLHMHIPCFHQESKWREADQNRYRYLMEQADLITQVTDGPYNSWCMQKRNESMVNESDLILAISLGIKSGTTNCIDYAKRQNVEVVVKNPNEWIHQYTDK